MTQASAREVLLHQLPVGSDWTEIRAAIADGSIGLRSDPLSWVVSAALTAMEQYRAAGVAEERERAAKIAEEAHYATGLDWTPRNIATAIRASAQEVGSERV